VDQPYLIGHARPVRFLAHAREQERLGHALMFTGPAGVGRERCAVGLASGLLCDAAEPPLPFGCGECRSCRRVRAGSHPDVQLLMSEAEGVARGLREVSSKRQPSRDIRVDQIRELARVLRLKPYEGRARVAIVVDAHRMNINAANALLKTLEEPGDAAFLVLLTPHARAVLPTIASRCQRVLFGPLEPAEVEAVLRREGAENAAERARAAGGSAGAALAADVETASASERLEGVLEALRQGSVSARMDAAESLGKDRAEVDRTLGAAERELGALLRTQVAQEPAGASGPSSRRLRGALEEIQQARRFIAENANVQLTLEELLLRAAR
jgi:DNA polymerase-3 subunit delta'